MVLWDLIRDFYCMYIFGGGASNGTSYLGKVSAYNNQQQIKVYQDMTGNVSLSLGDYLSTTFTIITLIVFVFILYSFLMWLFKVVSGLLLLRN